MLAGKWNKGIISSLLKIVDPVNSFPSTGFSGFGFAVKPVNSTEKLLTKAMFFKGFTYKVNVCNKVLKVRVFKNSPQEVKLIFFKPEFSICFFWPRALFAISFPNVIADLLSIYRIGCYLGRHFMVRPESDDRLDPKHLCRK